MHFGVPFLERITSVPLAVIVSTVWNLCFSLFYIYQSAFSIYNMRVSVDDLFYVFYRRQIPVVIMSGHRI